ncbi:MAG TPA: hypothetical protein VHX20_11605 [Terracidiphilus sp.]|jgi:hypothetical protein|nr:hypothetical protein [Terracidiphilus sp.]
MELGGMRAEVLQSRKRLMKRCRKRDRIDIVLDRKSDIAILSQSLDQLDHLVAIAVLPTTAMNKNDARKHSRPAGNVHIGLQRAIGARCIRHIASDRITRTGVRIQRRLRGQHTAWQQQQWQ